MSIIGYYAFFFVCLSSMSVVTSHDCIQIDNKLFCQGAKYILEIPYTVDTVYVDQTMRTEGLQLLIRKKVRVIVTTIDDQLCSHICQFEEQDMINWKHHCQCQVCTFYHISIH